MCKGNATLCTLSQLVSTIVLGKRLWLEHVCKVCAQVALLLSFYKGWCSREFFAPFVPLGVICVVFHEVLPQASKEIIRDPRWLPLAGKEIVKILDDYNCLVRKSAKSLRINVRGATSPLVALLGLATRGHPRGPTWPFMAPRGFAVRDGWSNENYALHFKPCVHPNSRSPPAWGSYA